MIMYDIAIENNHAEKIYT